jgi:uncharacterized protein
MGRLLFLITLVFVLYTSVHLLILGTAPRKKRPERGGEPEELVQDPFCQTYIPKQTAIRRKVKGTEYFFCSPACLKNYLKKKP